MAHPEDSMNPLEILTGPAAGLLFFAAAALALLVWAVSCDDSETRPRKIRKPR
jgi:hypothetical protein